MQKSKAKLTTLTYQRRTEDVNLENPLRWYGQVAALTNSDGEFFRKRSFARKTFTTLTNERRAEEMTLKVPTEKGKGIPFPISSNGAGF